MDQFPKKVLHCLEEDAPFDDLYDELDKILEDNLPDKLGYTSAMPDFTRAVQLQSGVIYRVNVPGYFFKHPKSSGWLGNESSGVMIAQYPHYFDTWYHGIHYDSFKDGWAGSTLTRSYSGGCLHSNKNMQYIERNFELHTNADEIKSPAVSIQGLYGSHYLAVWAHQRKITEWDNSTGAIHPYRYNYLVSNG